jgi:glutathione S-transferase
LQEKNIYDDEQNLKELLQIGGKQQVPFLLDRSADISLYESDDIVEYLEQRYLK